MGWVTAGSEERLAHPHHLRPGGSGVRRALDEDSGQVLQVRGLSHTNLACTCADPSGGLQVP
eukprot:scaffold659_cov329-Prasinococcus_capsulatus_cf.AAC.39